MTAGPSNPPPEPPVAATENDAVPPVCATCERGCVVITGRVLTVSVAVALGVEPTGLVTVTE